VSLEHRRLVGGERDEQAAGGLGVVAERDELVGGAVQGHCLGREIAVAGVTPGADALRRGLEGARERRQAPGVEDEAGAAPAGDLVCVAEEPEPRHVGDRARLEREITPIKAELRTLLEEAGRKSAKTNYHRRFANNLLKIWPALWTFVTHEGVHPTNNAAERSLRGPVIHRKLSHGTRTNNGERFIERALSASVTCRLQHRSLYTYLSDLLTAHARGDPLPTLT